MTRASVAYVDTGHANDEAPPAGTAIVRPLHTVRAVRERYLQRFADPAEAAVSRSARAWAWALGECATSPVTDQPTAAPPTRSEIEAEIAEADRRRLSGSRENRADAAATVLHWLIGHDDHVPLRGPNHGALVGGSGDVIRTRQQIAQALHQATQARQRAAAPSQDMHLTPAANQHGQQRTAYFQGMIATLAWVLRDRPEAPISRTRCQVLTTRDLKIERVHAEDLVHQSRRHWSADGTHLPSYGEAVGLTISWLLGDSTGLRLSLVP